MGFPIKLSSLIVVISLISVSTGFTSDLAPAIEDRPIVPPQEKALKLLLREDAFAKVSTPVDFEDLPERVKQIIEQALKTPPQIDRSGNSTDGDRLETYIWNLDETQQGATFTLDPLNGLGTVNIFDMGDDDREAFDLSVPTVTYGDDDLFAEDLNSIPANNDERSSQASRAKTPKTGIDPYSEPSLLTQKDFDTIIGSLNGFWEVKGIDTRGGLETWLIQTGAKEAAQIHPSRREIQERLDELEAEAKRLERRGKVYVWERATGAIETVRQKRFKRLDLDEWNYLGEQIDPAVQKQIYSLNDQSEELKDFLIDKSSAPVLLDPVGFRQLKRSGAHRVTVSAASKLCNFVMDDAYFDGRTFGAHYQLHQTCMMNNALPDSVKAKLLGYAPDQINMLRVSRDPRTRQISLIGRHWDGRVHYQVGSHAITKVEPLKYSNSISAARLTPPIPSDEDICEAQFCNDHSCSYNRILMQTLLEKEQIYEQYLSALFQKEKNITAAYDAQLANATRSASRLEAVRHSTHIIQMLDEGLGALAEINGFLALLQDPSALKEDPFTVWETLKDVNSVLLRAENSLTDLDQNIESIRFVADENAKTFAQLNDQKSSDDWINLKTQVEDPVIDYVSSVRQTLSKKLDSYQVKVPYAGTFTLRDALASGAEFLKSHSSNLVDARSFRDLLTSDSREIKDAMQRASSLIEKAVFTTDATKKAAAIDEARAAHRDYEQLVQSSRQGTDYIEKKKSAKRLNGYFAAAQIALRLTKANVTEPRLKAMRKRILDFRQNIPPVYDNAEDYGAQLKSVKEQIVQVRADQDTTRKALRSLRPCFSQNCAAEWQNIELATLPAFQKRDDGSIIYNAVLARLDARLKDLEIQTSSAWLEDQSVPKVCPATASAPQDEMLDTDMPDDTSDCSICDQKERDLKALRAEIEHLDLRFEQAQDQSLAISELSLRREALLREMEADQKEVNTLIKVGDWHKNDTGWSALYAWTKASMSGVFPHLANSGGALEGSYWQSWQNLTDEGQTKLSDLMTSVMKSRNELQNVKRQLSLLKERQSDFEILSAQVDFKKSLVDETVNAMFECKKKFCGR